jgi:hypothetical protein
MGISAHALFLTKERIYMSEIKEQVIAPTEDAKPEVKKTRAKKGHKKIIIHKQSGSTGADDVTVSINGKVYLIKRDQEVEVPEAVIDILKNAIKTIYEQNEENEVTARDVLAYPFSVV